MGGEGMKKQILELTIVAAVAMTVTAGAEAKHRTALCENFSGQGPSPHHAYKPARCNVTVGAEVNRDSRANRARHGR